MDPVLAQIDVLLEDEELYQLIRSDFAKRYPLTEVTSRNPTPRHRTHGASQTG